MTYWLAYDENRHEEYEYSLHLTEEAAEAGARTMLNEDFSVFEDGSPDDDLSFEELIEWLEDDNGHYIGVREIALEAA